MQERRDTQGAHLAVSVCDKSTIKFACQNNTTNCKLPFRREKKAQMKLTSICNKETVENSQFYFEALVTKSLNFHVKPKIKINFLDCFCQKANLIWKNLTCPSWTYKYWSDWFPLSKHKFKYIYLNFHVKAKTQINLLDFLCENTYVNEFLWFYLSKHNIQLNFLDFSCQKANLIWKNMISNL